MSETAHAISPFTEDPLASAYDLELRPTTRELLRHSMLLLATVITMTFAGIFVTAPEQVPAISLPQTLLGYLPYVPRYYLQTTAMYVWFAILNPQYLAKGIQFSISLLVILFSHEMGHYLACRRYGVSATLPFFIPAPPLFIAGTFGAFIKIRSSIPSRRALFDIGLAGPLAGFVVLLPIAVMGIITMAPPTPAAGQGPAIYFNDPLLFRLIARVLRLPLDPNSPPNPYHMAAWIGVLVTSLNLMPVGQLDGGHGTFAVFGQYAHKLIGRIAFVTMATLAALGWFWHGSPSGFLYTVLLAVMLLVRHPQPQMMERLGSRWILVAILTLLVFVLSFWPFPITIT